MSEQTTTWESALVYDASRTFVSRDSVSSAIATLTARCEALEQDAEWRRRWHDRLGRGDLTEGKFYEWCEALTAKREELESAFSTLAELAAASAKDRDKTESRCQHLEQAVRAVNRHHWNEDGTACVDASCAKSHWLDGHAVEAALASLLPSQDETPGTDETRVSFAAGYTVALDDALKPKS